MKYSRKGRDITGLRFGSLVAIRLLDERSKNNQRQWLCKCDCGTESIILQGSLTTGNSKKCNDHPANTYKIHRGIVLLDVSTRSLPDRTSKIDLVDLDRVINFKKEPGGRLRWCAFNNNDEGHQRWGIYVMATDRKTHLHRLIAGAKGLDEIVDHLNGDTLDNRRSNLRVIDRATNNKNMRMRIDNTTGATGVRYKAETDNYCAEIMARGKKLYLGTFNTVRDAQIAYLAAAKALGFTARHGLEKWVEK